MNLRLIALGTLAVFLPLIAHSQDLAALARKEKERRARITKPVKVLTEDDGKAAAASGAGSVTSLGGSGTAPAESAETASKAQPPAEVEAQKAAWQARAAAARSAVTTAEKTLAQMEKDLSTYRSDMTPVSAADAQDPMRLQKRDARIVEMNKQIEAQKVAVADAKKAIIAFEEEARRAGVPAGWLR
ncbi:MAG: hypothetical protein ABI565_07720 [Vicinamibacteria bacterium]